MKTATSTTCTLPIEIVRNAQTLEQAGFEVYLVGGCVRDLLLNRKPKDWDLTTNATPEDIIKTFPKTFYENDYGTVGVVNEESTDETLKVVEITPYRVEAEYKDFRRPSSISFSVKLEDDLKRRDFTVNAIALSIGKRVTEDGDAETNDTGVFQYKGHLVDLYKGQEDLRAKTLRTVGDAHERFSEDALRMIRAVRIATDLGFTISDETVNAVLKHAHLLKEIAVERVRDEFIRLVMTDNPMIGIILCSKLGILKYIAPELEVGIGIEQNQAHSFDVWEHLLRSLQHAADKKWSLELRLAALFHDISKPQTRRKSPETGEWTFYGHEVVGSRETAKILTRLKFHKKLIDDVSKLVRWHMFFSDTEQITLSAVRRLIASVGTEHVWDLMNLRICDRVGTGRPKENPYRLRKYKAMIEEVMRDPVSVGMLKIDGIKIMEIAKIPAGPKIGYILHTLLENVLENPKFNTEEYLYKKTLELAALPENILKNMGEEGKKVKETADEKNIKEIRSKYRVE